MGILALVIDLDHLAQFRNKNQLFQTTFPVLQIVSFRVPLNLGIFWSTIGMCAGVSLYVEFSVRDLFQVMNQPFLQAFPHSVGNCGKSVQHYLETMCHFI